MGAIFNHITFKTKLDNLAQSKRFVGLARSAANTRLVFAKQDMMEEIDNHEVSKEIEESCANPAITSSEIISKGNIAAGLGFKKGSHPVTKLKQVLSEIIQMNPDPQIKINPKSVIYNFKIQLPSNSKLDEKLPVDDNWTSKSWVRIIEEGLTATMRRFIFWSAGFGKGSGSRSTTGLQSSRGIIKNPATFTPKEYLSEILNNFIEKFK